MIKVQETAIHLLKHTITLCGLWFRIYTLYMYQNCKHYNKNICTTKYLPTTLYSNIYTNMNLGTVVILYIFLLVNRFVTIN